jgi:hypothetical protein
MTLWANASDVTDRWVGSDEPTDTTLITALINDAEAVILAKFPKIQDRIDADTLPEQLVIIAVVRMVTRVLRNPENLSSWQQTTGPFSQSRTFGRGDQDIWLSDEEIELLSPKVKGKAYEVDLAPYAGVVIVTQNQPDWYGVWEDTGDID